MPIANYRNPGVYVTQAANPLSAVNVTNSLNTCFFASISGLSAPTSTNTDTFSSTSNVTTFTPTVSGALAAGLIVKNSLGAVLSGTTNGSGFGSQPVDYNVTVTNGSIASITISGNTSTYSTSNPLSAQATYNYYSATPGQVYTFYTYNDVQRTFGNPFTYASGTSVAQINSPASLAAWLAFRNGAQVVSCVNLPNNGNTPSDFFAAIVSGMNSTPGLDVIVPLVYDSTSGPTNIFVQLANFLDYRATQGSYSRAFVGLDSNVQAASLINTVSTLANSISSTRITLAVPQKLTFNPGINSQSGVSTGNIDINGYYLAAALAGVFAGQTDVYIPITRKNVSGFVAIPNQVSVTDSNTLQSLGSTVIRQRSDGSIYVRHGLTTDTTNWITQEISLNAIGDRLANNIAAILSNSNLIGSPMTQTTLVTLQSIVLTALTQSVDSDLIQSYQNLRYSLDPNNPTTVNVSFQYSPTYPLNYIQVVFSLNSQSGQVQFSGVGV